MRFGAWLAVVLLVVLEGFDHLLVDGPDLVSVGVQGGFGVFESNSHSELGKLASSAGIGPLSWVDAERPARSEQSLYPLLTPVHRGIWHGSGMRPNRGLMEANLSPSASFHPATLGIARDARSFPPI
jgi:hypothetical protein